MKKKIFAVCLLFVVLTSVLIIPCSAFSVPYRYTPVDQEIYLYSPVSFDLTTIAPNGGGRPIDWACGQTEKDTLNYTYTVGMVGLEGASQNVTFTNNYRQIYNQGFVGDYTIAIVPVGSGEHTEYTTINEFSLPSTWAIRTLKLGENAPQISITGYEDPSASVTLNYSCNVLINGTTEVVTWHYTEEVPFGLPFDVLPTDLRTFIDTNNWSNYVITDYKCTLEHSRLLTANTPTIKVVLPSNGACARTSTPYTVEYTDSYVEKISKGTTIKEYPLDFTNWLGSAFAIFDIELFGNFTIGGMLATVVGIALFLAFIKVFAGG